MKKIFLLFLMSLTVCMVNKNQVFAEYQKADLSSVTKPFVCVEGEDYSKELEKEGYSILSNNVNFSVVGKYNIEYIDNETKECFSRRVDVIDKKQVQSLGYYQTNPSSLFLDSNQTENYIDNLTFADKNFLVHTLMDPNNQEIGVTSLLSCFENNNLKWQITIATNSKILIKKIITDGISLYLVGLINNEAYDVYVAIYNLNGKFINEMTVVGNKVEKVIDAKILNDHLFIAGTTNSTSGYYSGVRKMEDSYLLKIDKDTLVLKKIHLFDNEGLDNIEAFMIHSNYLYFVHSYLNNGIKHHILYQMDEQFNINETMLIGPYVGFETISLASDNQVIYLLSKEYSYKYEKDIARLYKLSFNLKITSVKNYSFEGYTVIPKDMVVNDSGIGSLLFFLQDENQNTGYSVIKFQQDTELFEIRRVAAKESPKKFTNEDGNSFYFTTNQKISITKINSIQVLEFGPLVLNGEQNAKDYQVIINSVFCNHQPNLSKLQYSLSKFGTYRLIYGFETPELVFYYHLDSKVNEQINVRQDEVYDVGYCLNFNGMGTLNGQDITNNYFINEEGSYILEVVGNNNYYKQIHFKIKSYSSKPIFYSPELKIEKIIGSSTTLEDKVNISLTKDNSQVITNHQENIWLLIFPVITILTCAVYIIRLH